MKGQNGLTPDEQDRLDWCLSVLDEEHGVECDCEANQIALKESNARKAYADLLALLVRLKVREREEGLRE